MADQTVNTETVAHESVPEHQIGFMSPEVNIVILTWLAFVILLVILKKYAWQPILSALDAREAAIRKSIEDADRAKEELNKINETRAQMIAEAEHKAREMLEQARKAAVEAAKMIEQKARSEGQILVENALREIKAEKEKAQASFRSESVHLVVELASKLIQENLDTKKNRELVDKLVKEI